MSDTAPVPPPLRPTVRDPLLGMKLGDYIVESLIATGGMGMVYRAMHPILGKAAAVKVLRPEYAGDDEQVMRFLKEAQAISAIHHRGIINVTNFGHLPDGRHYMVMDFLDGESLEAVLLRDAPLPPVRALPILDEVLDALSAAHKVGVVHRDLKPSNVFITRESNGTRYAKLVDFGLAKQAPPVAEGAEQPFAKASLVAGTPEYISPEQARGLAATPRTDLYCFGVMAFEVLTGKLPFASTSVDALLRAHVNDVPPRMSALQPDVPEALDHLVAQLLEKEPDARPQSADVVRQVLGRVLKQLREESTRQGHVLPPRAIDAPATDQAHAKPQGLVDAAPSLPQERRPEARTDVVSRTPSEDLRLVRPSRWPLALALLFFFVGAGVLTWAFWGGEGGRLPRPAVEVPHPVLPSQPLVAPAPEPKIVPAVATAEVGEEDLVPLEPGSPKPKLAAVKPPPAAPGPEVEKKQDAERKPDAVALPVPPTITVARCEPTEKWKRDMTEDLRKLSSKAAKEDLAWSEEAESALQVRINTATTNNECATAKADYERLWSSVVKQ